MFNKGLIFLLCASTVLWAQFMVGTIAGRATDEGGAPLGQVKVTVRHLETGRLWSVLTDEEGKYMATSLPLGSYLIEASMAKFTTVFRGVPLRSAREVALDFTLKADAIARRAPGENPAELPGPQTGEPTNEPAPAATDENAGLVSDAQISPEPAEQPPTNQFTSPGIQGVRFAVQIAAFRANPKAQGLKTMLQGRGYAAYVVEADIPESGHYYRVRVGPFGTSGEARDVALNLKSRFAEELSDFWIVPYGQ